MKLLNLATFLTALVVTFSSCVGISPTPGDKVVVDQTLPIIELTQNGVFVDMKSIGFEWNEIIDPRVNGIYVYKQKLGEDSSEFKFYETIENRFATHYIDEDVKPGNQYAYYFKTYTKKSESNPSKKIFVNASAKLDSVSWIHAVENMPRSAKIIWRPHTNEIVQKYIIERKTLEEDKWDEIETLEGRLYAEYIDSKLKDSFVYKYRIRVKTYNGIISKPSKEVRIITKALPKEIENITATKNLPKEIRVRWNSASIKDFNKYIVYRANKINGNYKIVSQQKEVEYSDKIEEDGKDYFYRISSVDKDGLESVYNVKSIHGRSLVKPNIPALVEAKMEGVNLRLKWKNDDQNVKSYTVVKTTKKGWFDVSSEEFLNIRQDSFLDTAVERETTYGYTVYSLDAFSIKSNPSIEVKYTTNKNEGRKIIVDTKKDVIKVNKVPLSNDRKNVIQPMDDIDVSSL